MKCLLVVVVVFPLLASCSGTEGGTVAAPATEGSATAGSYEWREDCGTTAYRHAPHNPSLADSASRTADEYAGEALAKATQRAAAAGFEVRVLGEDGDCADRTDEVRTDRVNFYVVNGDVAAAARY